jgi:hypothetical protein
MFEAKALPRAKKFTKDPVLQIMMDFKYIGQTTLPSDPVMAKKWELKDTSAASWLNWFGERVKIISAADHTEESFWSKRFTKDTNYPISNDMYEIAEAKASNRNLNLAENITGKLLLRSYHSGYAFKYKSKSYTSLVGSQHFGLIILHNQFFVDGLTIMPGTEDYESSATASFVSSIARVAALLHEARHSDGHDDHIGFLHSKCPQGHPLAGTTDCDRMINGPYSTEADFTRLYIDQCKKNNGNRICTESEMDTLEGIIQKANSYVLDPEIYPFDGDGKKTGVTLDPRPIIIKGVPQIDIPRS